ncbi:hypothetical protein BH160DRAFT_3082 [Burkholderia sp. H160]|nr:hypothetical protein BH160DRAFT_3082 [Burkholderia sp. H160]
MGFPGMPCLGRHAYAWRLLVLQTGSRPVGSLCVWESFRADNETPGLCFVKKERPDTHSHEIWPFYSSHAAA